MTPCSATVWYALLVNASMRRSAAALASSSSARGGVQPAAFISTAVSSGRGTRSFGSWGAVGDGRRAAARLAREPGFPSRSSLTAVDSGGLWVRHQHQPLPRTQTRNGRWASNRTPSSARVLKGGVGGGGVRRGISVGAAADSRSVVDPAAASAAAADTSVGGRQDASGNRATGQGMKVTLLSGFLGAGKTTLMQNVLRQAKEERLSLAVIVNDMADVNIDAQLLGLSGKGEQSGGGLAVDITSVPTVSSDTTVSMEGGCICCTLKDDLLLAVEAIARRGKHQHLIIESTGISDPMPVAEALVGSDLSSDSDGEEDSESNGGVGVAVVERDQAETQVGEGEAERELYSVDTLVTVVDSTCFLDEVREADYLEDRGMEAEEGDTRTIADLLVAQVEFANVILLNKADLVSEADLSTLEGVVRRLNPAARVVRTVSSDVGLAEVLGTGDFDLEEASQAAGWVQALNGDHVDRHHRHLADMGSFSFRAKRPFHPERLMGFVMEHLPSVLRSKGFLWLATRNDQVGVWTQAGGSFATEYGGEWDDDDDDNQEGGRKGGQQADGGNKPGERQATAVVASIGSGGGDDGEAEDDDGADSNTRHTELVFIGLGMDDEALKAALQLCLLTDGEMAVGPKGWRERFEDPFPPWQ